MTRRFAGLLMAGLLVAGCSGGSDDETKDGPTAEALAASLKADVSSITKTVTITEDNDPNDSIGRPGSYSEAVSIYDSRADCGEDDLSVDCGAKIEVFDSAGGAKDRMDYIQKSLKDNPILGSEYNYVIGNALLRVSGTLKPSEAKEYEVAAS